MLCQFGCGSIPVLLPSAACRGGPEALSAFLVACKRGLGVRSQLSIRIPFWPNTALFAALSWVHDSDVRLLGGHPVGRSGGSGGLRRTLVFGAGDGGEQIVSSMMRSSGSPFVPVAVLDDDPAKHHTRLLELLVVGDRTALAEAAHRYRADTLLIAVPSARTELVRGLVDSADGLALDIRILPSMSELLGNPIDVSHIRPVRPVDLLGRNPVHLDLDAVGGYLRGRRVLVTGAGGSIGSELCRQLSRLSPDRLVMLDRDETALHSLQLSMEGKALLDSRDLVVCSIRDRHRLAEVFAEHRPDVVFHAAALKHLPLLEMHPAEAVKSNVWGTQNVLDAALGEGVRHFVNISTDKAAAPESVLGYSKRLAERLTAAAATDGRMYISVRFGNVLGSRGSVLDTFLAQIENGGPVTVTDPDVTRYFMTVEEAVSLVLQAGAVGRPGEALVLDMGEPMRIADLARRLIADSGRSVDLAFTGLRPGEKLHETRLSRSELDRRPGHPMISHVDVAPLRPEQLAPMTLRSRPTELVQTMQLLCTASGAGQRRDAPVEAVAFDRWQQTGTRWAAAGSASDGNLTAVLPAS